MTTETADLPILAQTPAERARRFIEAEKKAREQAAVDEFNETVKRICREHRVSFHVGMTVWADGRNAPQVLFVAQD